MQGLELSERYYRELCAPMLEADFPDLCGRIAAGLAGEGSECLGFDDEISRDHDWGAAVCLWLTAPDYEEHGESLRRALLRLPESFAGYPARQESRWGTGRTGVLEIGRFYFKFLGHSGIPPTDAAWLTIPEANLAAATSGRVFADPLGEFSRIRQALLAFYPEDARLKKLAARCARMAQAGQYNFPRCAARKEYVATLAAKAAFIEAACSAVFLLNKRYMPFYKWMHRALKDLPLLGTKAHERLATLAATQGAEPASSDQAFDIIEEISAMVINELKKQGLSSAQGDFLLDHALAVQNTIQDDAIRNIDVSLG